LVANIYGKYDEDLSALGLEDDSMIQAWDPEATNWVLPKFTIDKKEVKMMGIRRRVRSAFNRFVSEYSTEHNTISIAGEPDVEPVGWQAIQDDWAEAIRFLRVFWYLNKHLTRKQVYEQGIEKLKLVKKRYLVAAAIKNMVKENRQEAAKEKLRLVCNSTSGYGLRSLDNGTKRFEEPGKSLTQLRAFLRDCGEDSVGSNRVIFDRVVAWYHHEDRNEEETGEFTWLATLRLDKTAAERKKEREEAARLAQEAQIEADRLRAEEEDAARVRSEEEENARREEEHAARLREQEEDAARLRGEQEAAARLQREQQV